MTSGGCSIIPMVALSLDCPALGSSALLGTWTQATLSQAVGADKGITHFCWSTLDGANMKFWKI